MMRRICAIALAATLASCGKSSDTTELPKASSDAVAAPVASIGDACMLITDPAAVFGFPVTAHKGTMPNKTTTCEWRGADERMCGSVVVFGPGWNEVEDVPVTYAAMVTSLGAFGQMKEIAGLGDEAKGVDGGILGAQVAFRAKNATALVGSTCTSGSLTKLELAERVAGAVAEKL
jgi:hypothetical protein